MEKYNNLPNEIKKYIITFLDRKCFRCNKKILYLNKDKYYKFFPPFLDNDEDFEGYTVCPLCAFSLQIISCFTNKHMFKLSTYH